MNNDIQISLETKANITQSKNGISDQDTPNWSWISDGKSTNEQMNQQIKRRPAICFKQATSTKWVTRYQKMFAANPMKQQHSDFSTQ